MSSASRLPTRANPTVILASGTLARSTMSLTETTGLRSEPEHNSLH